MPYSNAIFHIDPVSGSDANRTALTLCTALNPAGSITRIFKTGHGLTTGAVVDLTLFTAWLNSAWKITVVDADNFDLDGAVWIGAADNSGTVTPRGGSSWADAWLTTGSGARAARIQPGDEIRFPVTPEVGTGVDATFTNGSKVITLTSALTKPIQHGDDIADWTLSANITGSNLTTRKYGANTALFQPAAGFTVGTIAYALVEGGGAQDFSAFSKISFWFRASSASSFAANTFRIRLCSDAAGGTTVNALVLNEATLNTTNFHSIVLDYGSALGNNIRSIAIDCLIDPGTVNFSFHNIVACNGVTHNSIIGPENDCMYCVQSLDGTTVAVDSANITTAGNGWSGTSGTYELFYINPYISKIAAVLFNATEAGTASSLTSYTGGYDTITNTVVGRTCFLNHSFSGTGFHTTNRDYTIYNNFGLFRFSTPINSGNFQKYSNIVISNTSSVPTIYSEVTFDNCFFLNGAATQILSATTGGSITCNKCVFANNSTSSVTLSRTVVFFSCIFRNSNQAITLNAGSAGSMRKASRLYKCLVSDTTEFSAGSGENGILWSYDHDQTSGNHWGFTSGGTINWQTAVKNTGDPGAWRVVHSSTDRTSLFPIRFEVAQVAVSASSLVTVNVWVKKDHATNVGCKIFVEGEDYTLAGIVSDSDTAADNTSWQQLSISFTPTVSGVVPIWFDSFFIGGSSNTYLGSITVTQ